MAPSAPARFAGPDVNPGHLIQFRSPLGIHGLESNRRVRGNLNGERTILIGLAFGPVQASSRSYMARSVTAEESGRYFGIYALAGRATSFLAPFLIATVTATTGSPRLGMSMIILFLVGGMAILAGTPYPADKTEHE